MAALICAYDWDCATAIAVFECESHLDPLAVSADDANYGLAQLNERTWRRYFGEPRWSHVLEAEANLGMAWEVYELAGGFGAWACAGG